MTNVKIAPQRVGKWCLPYLQERIEEASKPLQDVLVRVELTQGYTFLYVPQGVTVEKHYNLELGGVVPGVWKTSNTMEFSSAPQEKLCHYIWKWLRKEHATRENPSFPNHFILGEHPLWRPGDPFDPDFPHSFVCLDTLYVCASSDDNLRQVRSLIEEVDLSYPPLLLIGIVGQKSIQNCTDIFSIFDSDGKAEWTVKLIVLGVFDGESFLVWRLR